MTAACERCLARTWLLTRLGPRLEYARGRIEAVLALGDEELIAAVGGRRAGEYAREFAALPRATLRDGAARGGLELLCRCEERYPRRLRELAAPPAVLHVAGGLDRLLAMLDGEPVAVVGSRAPSEYGREVARALGRGLASAGLPVISGMASGIDAAAHAGALEGGTIAVLAVGTPPRRGLHRRILAAGAAVSELGPGTRAWRWTFPARNRLIAALTAATVVVEAGARSGALITAAMAARLGRPVGAVPGRITTPQAAGTNALLAGGAFVVRGGQDVLDAVYGAGARAWPAGGAHAGPEISGPRPAGLEALLAALADGEGTAAALAGAGLGAGEGLAALAELELAGLIRRLPGGGYTVLP